MRMLRVLCGVFAICMATLPAHAGAIDDRAQALLAWIGEHTDYDVSGIVPRILKKDKEYIQFLGTRASHKDRRGTNAVTTGNTVYLMSSFVLGEDDHILLHELVHVVQNRRGDLYRCRTINEGEAYALQDQFSAETGIGERVDTALLYLLSFCPNHYGLP